MSKLYKYFLVKSKILDQAKLNITKKKKNNTNHQSRREYCV